MSKCNNVEGYYAGLVGLQFQEDELSLKLGEGLASQRDYAHLMQKNTVAFKLPTTADSHLPGPWKAAIRKSALNVHTKLFVPPNYRLLHDLTRREVAGCIAATIRSACEARGLHWPSVLDEQAWSPEAGGFAIVTRTSGRVEEVVIRKAHKNMFNASSMVDTTDMTVWLCSQASGVFHIESEEGAAFESDYGGERGVTKFRRHLRSLKHTGLIDYWTKNEGGKADAAQ